VGNACVTLISIERCEGLYEHNLETSRSNEKFTGVWRYVAVITGLMLTGTVAQAAVLGSRHDLGGAGQAQQTTTATTEVCVFCHTPHGAQTNASVPLWNKRLQQPAGGYTRYSTLNTSTLDGTEAPVGSVSLACLRLS